MANFLPSNVLLFGLAAVLSVPLGLSALFFHKMFWYLFVITDRETLESRTHTLPSSHQPLPGLVRLKAFVPMAHLLNVWTIAPSIYCTLPRLPLASGVNGPHLIPLTHSHIKTPLLFSHLLSHPLSQLLSSLHVSPTYQLLHLQMLELSPCRSLHTKSSALVWAKIFSASVIRRSFSLLPLCLQGT